MDFLSGRTPLFEIKLDVIYYQEADPQRKKVAYKCMQATVELLFFIIFSLNSVHKELPIIPELLMELSL